MITIESFIVGSMLGDGYFVNKQYDYNLYFQHGIKQTEYILWKKEIAENLGFKTSFYNISISKSRRFPAIRVSVTLPKDIHKYFKHKFYPNNNKTITRHLLNYLDNEGLSIWYQDDGCLSIYTNPNTNKTQRYIKWCTEGFNYEEHIILQRYLKNVWNLESTIRPEKHKYYFLYLGANSAKSLIDRIIVCPSMLYKTDLKYHI